MENLNIRLFKTICNSDSVNYEIKYKEGKGSNGFETLKGAAEHIKWKVEDFFKKEGSEATVDFKPFHDFEIPKNLAPKKCIPLTREEIDLFYKFYIS